MKDAGELEIISSPRVKSEGARDARARAWRFVFDCYAKKKAEIGEEKADVSTADEDAKKEITSDECDATPAIPR